MPSFVFADTGTTMVSPPHSSGARPWLPSSCFTRSGSASGLSILLTATMIGTSAARAWLMASTRLRHDAVVGGDDQDDDVRHLGAARAHGGERLVARRVEEGDLPPAHVDRVGADVLRDAAGLARRDVGRADRVEQRRLAVVDVAHDRDDRARAARASPPSPAVLLGLEHLLDVEGDVLDLVLELAGDQRRRVEVEHLVDGRHHAHVDELLEDLAGLDAHRAREVADGDHLRDADRRASTRAAS